MANATNAKARMKAAGCPDPCCPDDCPEEVVKACESLPPAVRAAVNWSALVQFLVAHAGDIAAFLAIFASTATPQTAKQS